MRCVSIEKLGPDEYSIHVEKPMFFGLIKRDETYKTSGNRVAEYYRWIKLPYQTMVGDYMAFQLDTWLREWKSKKV
jgi:hypothetical protein